MRLHPILAGEILLADRFSICGPGVGGRLRGIADQLRGRGARWAPVPVFLLEHPREGPVLIDTGYAADAAGDPRRTLGVSAQLFEHRPYDLTVLLAERGVTPGDVGTVVMTHFHSDHVSGIERFPDATVVADRTEWIAGERGGRGLSTGGYVPELVRARRRRQVIEFDGPRARPHGPLPATVDLFGDGSVVLVSTPGHTAGHLSVLVRPANGPEILLTGDAVHRRRQLEHPAPMVPMTSRGAFLASAQRLRAYTRLHPEAVVIPGHDRDAWQALAPVYG